MLALVLQLQTQADTLKVTSQYAPLYLGHKVMGYLPEGTIVKPIKQNDDHYLVEILVDGRFRSMAWTLDFCRSCCA